MDIPHPKQVICEAAAFLRFSITHACFHPAHTRQIRDEIGLPHAFELRRYLERTNGGIAYRCGSPPPHRTSVRCSTSPPPREPHIADPQLVAYFVHVRARKPL